MRKSKKNIYYKNGFGLIEVVVAVSIISSSILFVMFVAQLSQRVIGDGVSRLQAAFLAEEGSRKNNKRRKLAVRHRFFASRFELLFGF